ncbi:MAG: alpha/beta hydrolase [archaeon]
MPNPDEPEIDAWVGKLKEIVNNPNKETYFIGHSVVCQWVLRYLETLDSKVKIGGVIFIAPWMKLDEKTIEEEGEEVVEMARPWVETPIDWDKVKSHEGKFVCPLSDNNPYVPLSNKELFEERLGAKIIIEHGKGHYDSDSSIESNETVVRELDRLSE